MIKYENKFDEAAAQWDQKTERMERTQVFASELKSSLPLNKSMRAIEIGCGTGSLALALEDSLGYILGIDSSPEMVKMFLRKIIQLGLHDIDTISSDICRHRPEGRFDLAYSALAMHHIEDIEMVLSRLHDILSNGGKLAFIDLYEEDGSFHQDSVVPHNGFSPEVLKNKLHNSGFTDIEFRNIFSINKETAYGDTKSFPVFLCTAHKAT